MKPTRVVLVTLLVLSWTITASPIYAQRGMGDATGVARQQIAPKLINVSGKLLSIETQPCEKTTGYGRIGTHLTLKTGKRETLEIDLGSAIAVESIVKRLAVGQRLKLTIFRTEKMPKNRYVAKSLTLDGKTWQLRDDSLRPNWAGGRGGWASRPGRGGYGYGYGPSRGQGRGRGWNAGYCPLN